MVMASVKPITIKYAIIVNLLFTDALNDAHIQCLSYQEITRIDPARRNWDSPQAYISVGNHISKN